mmetsp:Transcript_76418/g.163874  ORF Transcript_76418/g.163874 Transcript_76418/m.163874 type:complete len:224 (+) Transcript_76418:187-858(+)
MALDLGKPIRVTRVIGGTQQQWYAQQVRLGHSMSQYRLLVLKARGYTFDLKLGHERLQVQYGMPVTGPVQEAEVATGHGIVGPDRCIPDKNDAMPRIAKERQETPTLVVKAVAGPSDLSCPREVDTIFLARLKSDPALPLVIQRMQLHPTLQLLLAQALQLLVPLGVDPLTEVALCDVLRHSRHHRLHGLLWAPLPMDLPCHITLMKGSQRHQQLSFERSEYS